jgi:hypothetical protein
MRSRSSSAASVMAAGSVISEPITGTTLNSTKYDASARGNGSSRDSTETNREPRSRIGRVPATTMIAKTNSGSVKLRSSR